MGVTDGFEVVAGSPDEVELAALLAAGSVIESFEENAAPSGTEPASEWSARGRAGGRRECRVPGATSRNWRYSLRG